MEYKYDSSLISTGCCCCCYSWQSIRFRIKPRNYGLIIIDIRNPLRPVTSWAPLRIRPAYITVPMVLSRNMAAQAQDLVDRAAADERIDFDNDWKVITLFVGGNDLCASCRNVSLRKPYPIILIRWHRQTHFSSTNRSNL